MLLFYAYDGTCLLRAQLMVCGRRGWVIIYNILLQNLIHTKVVLYTLK